MPNVMTIERQVFQTDHVQILQSPARDTLISITFHHYNLDHHYEPSPRNVRSPVDFFGALGLSRRCADLPVSRNCESNLAQRSHRNLDANPIEKRILSQGSGDRGRDFDRSWNHPNLSGQWAAAIA